jgi:hypothetical protein
MYSARTSLEKLSLNSKVMDGECEYYQQMCDYYNFEKMTFQNFKSMDIVSSDQYFLKTLLHLN